MSQKPPISLFVKLGYWDVYRLNVVLIAAAFRKILYIWGFVALLWLSVSALLLIRPSSAHDWAVRHLERQAAGHGLLHCLSFFCLFCPCSLLNVFER